MCSPTPAAPWIRRASRPWRTSSSASARPAGGSSWSAPGPSAPGSADSIWASVPPAVGPGSLVRVYVEGLAGHGTPTAQILLTASDFDNRARYLNARITILTLFEYGCLPIINENDTVSVAEIRFGDNDHLAAMVTNLLQAPLLILLTVVDGLFATDPASDPNAALIPVVPHIDAAVTDLAGPSK